MLLSEKKISHDDITLELAIKIAKHGNVHRMRYASAVGLLKNKIGCFSSHANDDGLSMVNNCSFAKEVLILFSMYSVYCIHCIIVRLTVAVTVEERVSSSAEYFHFMLLNTCTPPHFVLTHDIYLSPMATYSVD